MTKYFGHQDPSDILADGPHYDVKAHLAHVQKLWKSYPYRDAQKCVDLTLEMCDAAPDYIAEELVACVATLLEDNDIFIPHEPTLEYAPYLTRMQKRLTVDVKPALFATANFIDELCSILPKNNAALSLPLADRTTAVGFIGFIYRIFYDVTSSGEQMFPDLRQQLHDNLITASGYDVQHYDGKHKLVKPTDSSDSEDQKYAKYLANTSFLKLLTQPVPFAIPLKAYTEHGFLFAKSGHGKSQTMRTLLTSLLDEECAIFLLDGNGALIENLDKVASIKDRLVVLDPDDTPALNFFSMSGASREKQMELFFYLFKAIDQGLTERQATMVAYLVDLMQAIEGATLDTLRQVCETKVNLFPDALVSLPEITQAFFNNVFYAQKPDALTTQTKQQIAQRLYTIARNHTFNAMFSAPQNKFNALELMQQKKIVVVDTSRDKLGDHGSAIFGRYILAQCLAAAWQRPKNQRHLCLIMVDEAKTYLDDQSKKILSDARAFGVGMLLASQFPDQLDDGVRKEVVNNTTIKFAGPASFSVVNQLNRDMRCEVEFIMGMKKQDFSHAEWACYVDNLTPHAVKLTIPFGSIEKLPQMSAGEHLALRARNRALYGANPPAPQIQEPPTAKEAGRQPTARISVVPPLHKEVTIAQPQTSKKKPEHPQTTSPVTELDTDH